MTRSHASRGNASLDALRLLRTSRKMTRTRYRVYETEYPYFMTCTIVGWVSVFTRPEMFQIVYDSWKWFHDQQRLKLFAYVIMENHLHFVASGRT